MSSWRIYVAGKYPIFLLDLNQIWSFSIDFRLNPKYQISLNSLQW
jgi:hypothetical protein